MANAFSRPERPVAAWRRCSLLVTLATLAAMLSLALPLTASASVSVSIPTPKRSVWVSIPYLGDSYGIAMGTDGNMWVAGDGGVVARITASGAVTSFALGGSFAPDSIVAGPDGNMWFTEYSGVGRITPQGVITQFPVGAADEITRGPDGNLWFTTGSRIARLTPQGAATYFSVPGLADWSVQSITAGSDGNLWFTAYKDLGGGASLSRVGRISPTGQLLRLFRVPVGDYFHGITSGPNGDIWVSGQKDIGRITPSTGRYVQFSVPSGGAGLIAGPDGNVWFSTVIGFGRITPHGSLTYFASGVGGDGQGYTINDLAAGPGRTIWWTDRSTPFIGPTPPSVGSFIPPEFACVVPSLHGRTLAEARQRVHHAGCQLHMVVQPSRGHHACAHQEPLTVASQRPNPASRWPGLSPISIRLACPSASR